VLHNFQPTSASTGPPTCPLLPRLLLACREDLPAYAGPWPQRLFLAMGSDEYRGIQPAGKDVDKKQEQAARQWDEMLVAYCEELAELLGRQSLDASRLRWQVRVFDIRSMCWHAGMGKRGGGVEACLNVGQAWDACPSSVYISTRVLPVAACSLGYIDFPSPRGLHPNH